MMKKRYGISLIVLIITIIVIVILAGSVILNLIDNNPILQATKASFLNDIKNLQTELELNLSKEYLDSMGSYDITLLQANETSVTYKGVENNDKNIYDLIPSLKSNSQYSGQVEIIDGKLIYKGTDTNKQEWAKEVGIVLPLDIAVGQDHTAALMYNGTVKMWGSNVNGQLGNGTTVNRSIPIVVPGLTDVKQIVAGSSHTAALLNDGTVKVWGWNNYGVIGDGTTVDKSIPTLVSGLTNVKEIVSGGYHMLAILNTGEVMAWGANYSGQLGDGTTVKRLVPTLITGLSDIKQIVTGSSYTIALLNTGEVMAWGNNYSGQLGLGTTVNMLVPTSIPNLTNVKELIACSSHTLALLNSGMVVAWGANYYGQLGDGTTVNKLVPTPVVGLSEVKKIFMGDYHNFALLNNGTIMTWGYNNKGQLGDGTTVDKIVPTTLQSITNVKKIAGGYEHTLALLNDGTLKVWGDNSYGQLGDGTVENKNTPIQININDLDTTPPVVVFSQNGGNFPVTMVSASDLDGSIFSLKYAWSTQNTEAPTSGWVDFANGGTIARQNIDITEYLWIKATDSNNNTNIINTNVFTQISQVTVNKPLLPNGMTAKKWNGSSWETVVNPDTDTSWYNYAANKWANAQTLDGSMWVWIPRYEYKIQFPHTFNEQTISVNFMSDLSTVTTSGYIVHPAFTFGTVQLKGIWVAKFEASGTTAAVNIKPGVQAFKNITIGTMFTECRNMETNSRYGWTTSGIGIDTHLMKNVEWGAVTYLSNSKYGKNSEIWNNPGINYITGESGKTIKPLDTSTYAYDNTLYGINASTTGNVYGIYDMNGGVPEYTAAYVNNGSGNLSTYGSSLLNAASQYKDLYLKGTPDNSDVNYPLTSGKVGDAIYETSCKYNEYTNLFVDWYKSYLLMPYSSNPFFLRGGYGSNKSFYGVYNFIPNNGKAIIDVGFRPVLAVSNEL